MKANKWLGLITAMVLPLVSARAQAPSEGQPPPGNGAAVPAVSPGAAEVVKMAEAGTSDDVLQAYIKNSTSTFELSADQILYLRDIGVSSAVITSMLSRDTELRNSMPAAAPVPAPGPAEVPAPEPAPVTAPAVPPPAYVSSPPPEVGYFYDNLSPYGTWVQLDGVGWCWQPRVVVINHGWTPYCDSGHWVFTDAGWFWQSDYSWGWAPFHYGRWYRHDRCGWVWTPDRVWGPAWVTWRYEGEHCGWAPLPPHADFDLHLGYRFNGVHVGLDFDFGLRPDHFTFIALRDFHDHDFAHRRLAPAQVTQIYNHTTIINNYVVKNNTVVNQGIKVDRVSAATHTEFKKVAIRDTSAWSPSSPRERVSGKTELAVYRPELKVPVKPVNMVAQRVDDRHPTIQHAPVAPAKSQRPLVASSTVPGTGNRGSQGQNPGNYPRGAVDRAPAYSQPQPSPKLYRKDTPATTAPSSPPANRTDTARPAAPALRPDQERSTSSRTPSAPPTQPSGTRQYPLRSGTSTDTARPNPQGQNSQSYYPKGYYQSSETHTLPPANNARPSDSRGQSSPANRSGSSKRNEN